ncbi:50S ribosomal protein L5 [Candidatus Micrarchaeota archaeon]|nr:50S ribosomal protein L5 [Candidatus Micrarchaeota archaeon]
MMNKMQAVVIEKVTVNIGVGSPGERLDYAKELLSKLTGRKPVETKAKKRNPVWKLRVGLPIGVKVTLRGNIAHDFISKALIARRKPLSTNNFDKTGNVSFGVAEYIDFPGAKYDPRIGMFGFDVCVSLTKKGKRVEYRRIKSSKLGKAQKVSKQEAIEFVKSNLNAKIEES